jgi:hypothetical protein
MLCGTSLTTQLSVSCRLTGSAAHILLAQSGNALHASAGPAGAQARPAAAAGGLQPGQPGGVRQQLGNAVIARHRDDGPDPAAGQRKPLVRPVCCRAARHGTHDPIFPCSGTSSPLCPAGWPASRSPRGRPGHPARSPTALRTTAAAAEGVRRRQHTNGHRSAALSIVSVRTGYGTCSHAASPRGAGQCRSRWDMRCRRAGAVGVIDAVSDPSAAVDYLMVGEDAKNEERAAVSRGRRLPRRSGERFATGGRDRCGCGAGRR